ncbi:glycoside hydrolase family 3 protein [Paraliobacillus zengyii]|uniref:glycoside hydrolase family 3 protein n=1 Tax=Paraliobacillus zengyii TaxID=2213194 RepID=UPI000DD4910A|nr:glycoside hydrolase family 3 protein [Paraliobacillus zengyii]
MGNLFSNPTAPLEDRLNDLMTALTLEEMITLLSTSQSAIPRLGMEAYAIGGEAAHGIVDRKGGQTTVYPQPIGLSNTWNKALLHKVGSAIGDEARIFYYQQDHKTGLTLWAPTIDMERDPRWGRTEEAYGEDPYLTGQLSTELIKGMQGADPFYLKMVAAPKHFYGNNNEYGRGSISNSIDPRNRHEYYLKAFEPAFVEAKALSMMTAYNGVNGIPAMQLKEIEEVVRETWQMDGFIVSDGGALSLNVEEYGYYDSLARALADALKKGIDCFVDDKQTVEDAAKEALANDWISAKDIRKAVSRILKVRFRLGHFDADPSKNPYSKLEKETMCSPERSRLALKVTEEALVLLKNDNKILPLDEEKLQKIAVIGPTATEVFRDWYTGYPAYAVSPLEAITSRCFRQAVTYTSGHDRIAIKAVDKQKYLAISEDGIVHADSKFITESAQFIQENWGWNANLLKSVSTNKYLTLPELANVLQTNKEEVFDWFVREKIGFYPNDEKASTYHLTSWQEEPLAVLDDQTISSGIKADMFEKVVIQSGIEQAVEQAKQSDVAIVCVGNHPMVNGRETEDRPGISLPEHQQQLIQAVYHANPNTIVVVIGSYPFALNWEQDHIPAILYSAHGSQELGTAISNVLFGDTSPSGKLSMTWYKNTDMLPDIFDYDIIKGKRTYMYADENILYPFGHGLHYGDIVYQNLEIDQSEIVENSKIKLQIKLINKGERVIKEVAQVYATIVDSQVKRPKKKLVAFEKVKLNPGESQTVSFSVTADQLQVYDVAEEAFCLEQGRCIFSVGSSSEAIYVTADPIPVIGCQLTERSLTKRTMAENYDDYERVIIDKGEHEQNCITNQSDGWICFKQVNFEAINLLQCRVTTDGGSGEIHFHMDRLDNDPVATAVIETGFPYQWLDQQVKIETSKGKHDIYLSFKGPISLLTVQLMKGEE